MPGYTNKSREYLRRAVETQTPSRCRHPKLKETFLQVARVYRQLAGQLDARSRPSLKTRPSNRNGDFAA